MFNSITSSALTTSSPEVDADADVTLELQMRPETLSDEADLDDDLAALAAELGGDSDEIDLDAMAEEVMGEDGDGGEKGTTAEEEDIDLDAMANELDDGEMDLEAMAALLDD